MIGESGLSQVDPMGFNIGVGNTEKAQPSGVSSKNAVEIWYNNMVVKGIGMSTTKAEILA